MFRYCLFLILFSISLHASEAPFEKPSEKFTVVQLKKGALRMTGQPWRLEACPEELSGMYAIAPPRGSSTRKPGPGYTLKLKTKSAVYLAAHRRGAIKLGKEWKSTGLVLRWAGHMDDIYVQIVDKGEFTVPDNTSNAGGMYAVPFLMAASADLKAAEKLMSSPKPKPRRIVKPVIMTDVTSANQSGLYVNVGEPLKWRFRIVRGKPKNEVTSLKVKVTEYEGEFVWEKEIPVKGNRSDILEIMLPRIGYYELLATAAEECWVTPYKSGLGVVPVANTPDADASWGTMRALGRSYEADIAAKLGVSWVRHTQWDLVSPIIKEGQSVKANASRYLKIARAYNEHGINIMGCIQMIPRELSSKPNDAGRSGDAGPLYSRVAPKDWNQWEEFVEDFVKQCDGLIDYWEIGNEPNTPHHYWAGTVEEFAELTKRTAKVIRKVNPKAKIIFAGFTLNPSALTYLDKLLTLGCGEYMDILSVHSLYAKAVSVAQMESVLKKHGLTNIPVWSTEPKDVLAMKNFAAGVKVNMHFLLINPGAYGLFQNLSERDGSATRWGVAYAVCSKVIGTAEYDHEVQTGLPNVEAAIFKRGREKLFVASADVGPRASGVKVQVKALAGKKVIYTDLLGHERVVDSEFVIPLDRSGVLYGAKEIEVKEVVLPEGAASEQGVELSVEGAQMTHFMKRSDASRKSYAVTYKPANVSPKPSVTFPVELEKEGTYEIYVAAQWFPSHIQLISPFSWKVDNRAFVKAPDQARRHWRTSTRSHMRFGEIPKSESPAQNQILAKVGVVRGMRKGKHYVTIRLDKPRAHDYHYSMEIEKVVLRQIRDDHE